ncbi:MAG TPA: flagellar basal body-associated FliL family protein [Sphingomonas sp.]|nr:flagellar basal body-associated FliL family protein [Sphingomonas sp.]
MAAAQQVEASESDDAPTEVKPVAPASAGRDKKRLIAIGAAAAVLLCGGVGAAYAVMGGREAPAGAYSAGTQIPDQFVDIPEMTVNLRSADGTPRFLRVHLVLVASSAGRKDEISKKLPLVIDAYQPFLRELRPEDLAGSAAAFRLKEEMLIRANQELGDGAVSDVLIQDLVQQ